jgi:hypothetical protein
MKEINDQLKRRYAEASEKPKVTASWIKNRPNGSDTQELVRRQINRNQEEKDKTINNEEFLKDIKDDIFQQVEEYLLEKHGKEEFTRKMAHFNESWDKFYARYGNLLILSLGELTDDIEFLNHEGYMDKYKVSKQMESVAMRLGLQ